MNKNTIPGSVNLINCLGICRLYE